MKTCPTCRRSYADDSQAFCLDDGTQLVNAAPPEPTLISYQPPPPIQPQVYQSQPQSQPSWMPPPSWPPQPASAPTQYAPANEPDSATGARRMGLATVALFLGFLCLVIMIHLSKMAIQRSFLASAPLSRLIFHPLGMEFLLGLALVALTVMLAGIAITMAFKNPTRYAGRGRSLAAILMAVLSTVVPVSIFSVRRALYKPYTSTYYTPSAYNSYYTPAKDFIRPNFGSWTLLRSFNRDELRKISAGTMLTNLDRAKDAAGGVYQSASKETVSLIVYGYDDARIPNQIVDEFVSNMQGPPWQNTRTIPKSNGKRVESESSKGGALAVWSNGYWLLMVNGTSLSQAVSFADSVGY